MSTRDHDVLGKFIAQSEKLMKEGAFDDDSPSIRFLEEEWRQRQWVHPSTIYQAFVNGMILAEPWEHESNGDLSPAASVRAFVLMTYKDVSLLSLCEVYANFKSWTDSEKCFEWERVSGVSLSLVITNAVLWLREEFERLGREKASIEAAGDEQEQEEQEANGVEGAMKD